MRRTSTQLHGRRQRQVKHHSAKPVWQCPRPLVQRLLHRAQHGLLATWREVVKARGSTYRAMELMMAEIRRFVLHPVTVSAAVDRALAIQPPGNSKAKTPRRDLEAKVKAELERPDHQPTPLAKDSCPTVVDAAVQFAHGFVAEVSTVYHSPPGTRPGFPHRPYSTPQDWAVDLSLAFSMLCLKRKVRSDDLSVSVLPTDCLDLFSPCSPARGEVLMRCLAYFGRHAYDRGLQPEQVNHGQLLKPAELARRYAIAAGYQGRRAYVRVLRQTLFRLGVRRGTLLDTCLVHDWWALGYLSPQESLRPGTVAYHLRFLLWHLSLLQGRRFRGEVLASFPGQHQTAVLHTRQFSGWHVVQNAITLTGLKGGRDAVYSIDRWLQTYRGRMPLGESLALTWGFTGGKSALVAGMALEGRPAEAKVALDRHLRALLGGDGRSTCRWHLKLVSSSATPALPVRRVLLCRCVTAGKLNAESLRNLGLLPAGYATHWNRDGVGLTRRWLVLDLAPSTNTLKGGQQVPTVIVKAYVLPTPPRSVGRSLSSAL